MHELTQRMVDDMDPIPSCTACTQDSIRTWRKDCYLPSWPGGIQAACYFAVGTHRSVTHNIQNCRCCRPERAGNMQGCSRGKRTCEGFCCVRMCGVVFCTVLRSKILSAVTQQKSAASYMQNGWGASKSGWCVRGNSFAFALSLPGSGYIPNHPLPFNYDDYFESLTCKRTLLMSPSVSSTCWFNLENVVNFDLFLAGKSCLVFSWCMQACSQSFWVFLHHPFQLTVQHCTKCAHYTNQHETCLWEHVRVGIRVEWDPSRLMNVKFTWRAKHQRHLHSCSRPSIGFV